MQQPLLIKVCAGKKAIIMENNTVYAKKGSYDDGHTDLKKVANFLNYTNADVAKIAGVSEKSVRFKGKIPQAVKDRLEQIANICELVANNFNGDVEKTALWFRLENPMLGNISPKDMIRFGRYKKLRKFILDSIDGNLP